jgi:hypothetical protein
MPILQNPRHESFAQYRAHGAPLELAYGQAGYRPDSGHASRLARRPEVAARIVEVRARLDAANGGGPSNLVIALREARNAISDARGLLEAIETRVAGAPMQGNGRG